MPCCGRIPGRESRDEDVRWRGEEKTEVGWYAMYAMAGWLRRLLGGAPPKMAVVSSVEPSMTAQSSGKALGRHSGTRWW